MPVVPTAERLEACVRSVCPALHPAVLDVVTGGKRLRSRLMLLLAGDGLPVEVTTAVEMAHAASLLHDDVLDNQVERRGRPGAGRLLGNRRAILEGDMLLAGATDLLTAPTLLPLLPAFTRAVQDTCAGEVLQGGLLERGCCGFPEYRRAIRGKTGAFFGFAGYAGGWHAAGETAGGRLRELCIDFGELYQLTDDLEDITEDLPGSFLTFPAVLLAEELGGEDFLKLPSAAWPERFAALKVQETGRQRVAALKAALLARVREFPPAERLGAFIEQII